eukprot:g12386.t1
MRWKGEGVCCFILAGSGSIDAFRASRVLPHLLHLSTLSSGHLGQADLSGFRACVLLCDLMEWPASEDAATDLFSACKELASNGSATGSARNVLMLPFQEVQSIFGDILKAIAHCHAAHVCHRDLKFKNMMIDANSRVTMVDFGLAVQVAPGQELHDSCGTVPFASPEVMTCSCSKGYEGTAADTWSIAVCLVELLCGLGTVESIIGLTPDDENNFDHIAQQCLLLCTDYVHQLVLSYSGKDFNLPLGNCCL